MTNLLTKVPEKTQPGVAAMVRTIYQQITPEETHAQLDSVEGQLREPFPQAALLLEDAGLDILEFTGSPMAHWQKLWSNNPLEQLNKEIRRRTNTGGGNLYQPTFGSPSRWGGAGLEHDECAEG